MVSPTARLSRKTLEPYECCLSLRKDALPSSSGPVPDCESRRFRDQAGNTSSPPMPTIPSVGAVEEGSRLVLVSSNRRPASSSAKPDKSCMDNLWESKPSSVAGRLHRSRSASAILAENEIRDRPVVAEAGSERFASGGIPDADAAVGAWRWPASRPSGLKANPQTGARCSSGGLRVAGLDRPNPRRLIVAAGRQASAIRAEGRSPDSSRVLNPPIPASRQEVAPTMAATSVCRSSRTTRSVPFGPGNAAPSGEVHPALCDRAACADGQRPNAGGAIIAGRQYETAVCAELGHAEPPLRGEAGRPVRRCWPPRHRRFDRRWR